MDIKKRHMSADSILNSLNQQESMDVDVEGWYIYIHKYTIYNNHIRQLTVFQSYA
jgi:predicted small secreted protein